MKFYPTAPGRARPQARAKVLLGGFAILFGLVCPLLAGTAQAKILFQDVTLAAGLDYSHGVLGGPDTLPEHFCAGMAAGDYDRDGWPDLYAVTGDIGANRLFRNLGNGTFEEVAAQAGVAVAGELGCGPAFADFDNDGWIDLYIGGVEGVAPRLFRNQTDGTFVEVTVSSGLTAQGNSVSASFADVDRDGDLDLFATHWIHEPCPPPCVENHLWTNSGSGVFTPADGAAGLPYPLASEDHSFTANFSDIDGDGWLDLLVAGDFDDSRVFRNEGGLLFTEVTDTTVITDQNGMGAAVGDVDNDGDMDWFVSSIWESGTVNNGNRLYRNLGNGTFEDATDSVGVRVGDWGWGACFADFDNDGWLDLFHTNGWYIAPFVNDASKLFMSNGDGTLVERSTQLGLVDTDQGRGVVCFDYDRDGDPDVLVVNNSGPPSLYRNDGGNTQNYLGVRLRADHGEVHAIGARVEVETAAGIQTREVRCGNNFVSQQPLDLHFGLAGATSADVTVHWPTGEVDAYPAVAANQRVLLLPHNLFSDGFEDGDFSAWSSAAP